MFGRNSSLIWSVIPALVLSCVGTPCTGGEDGLGRWYPPGAGRQMGKYNWPYSYHTSAVPQRPGHGYFPTYWRDWHENAHLIFSEPEHTILPKREKRQAEKPEAETLPEPAEQAAEEEPAPPPPTELPPEETPEMPSENLRVAERPDARNARGAGGSSAGPRSGPRGSSGTARRADHPASADYS